MDKKIDKRIFNPGAPLRNPKGARVRQIVTIDPDTFAALVSLKKRLQMSYGELVDAAVTEFMKYLGGDNERDDKKLC